MFVREKKNKSGTVSVQIIEKRGGVYRVAKTVGSSREKKEIARLSQIARDTIAAPLESQLPLFASAFPKDTAIEHFLDSLENAHISRIGPELIFGTIFDTLGFAAIKPALFRHLVIARLSYPASKLKTVDYLARHHRIDTTEDAIYKFLDRFEKKHKSSAEQIAYEHTKKTLGTIAVVFYDMTTLYFEATDEDDLRKKGWSKDGKSDCPQIMVGLLVGQGGFPIGYDIFEGNTWEGKTLVPTLQKLVEKYDFGNPIIVADAAMLSKKNLEELKEAGYSFIVGGRVKNESEKTKRAILKEACSLADGATCEIARDDGTRLIVSFSKKRARKDAHNRTKGVDKLRRHSAAGHLTKEHLHNRGYNKFLTLNGDVSVTVDDQKVADDSVWDGLKGYVTNGSFTAQEAIKYYGDLWQIEYAFRISKTDLRIRPIYHYRRRRIEAHLCIGRAQWYRDDRQRIA